MIVAIPSKERPTGVKSQLLIPSARVYVPRAEVGDYDLAGVQNLVAVPDEIRGITATRNWILETEDERPIVMIDDDVKVAGWVEFLPNRSFHRKLNEAQWLEEWARLSELTVDLGYRIWGVATESSPRTVYPQAPLLFRTYITASCMGIVDRELRFDPTFVVKEDYELCLRCIAEDGGIVGARYLYWQNSHWEDAGGCRTYRTQAIERETIVRLIKKYGGMIRRVTRGGSEYSIELEF